MEVANAERGAVQWELQHLVSVQMHDTQKHCQAASESPLYDEICSIVCNSMGIQVSLKAPIDSLPGPINQCSGNFLKNMTAVTRV